MKKLNDHIIDRISRELLDDYSVEAPQGAFYSINRELNVHKQERRKRAILYIAASWVVLLSFGLGYLTRTISLPTTNLNAIQKNTKQLLLNQKVIASNNQKVTLIKKWENNSIANHKYNKTKKQYKNLTVQNTNTVNLNDANISSFKSISIDSTNKALSHNDSLKLIYKFISLSRGITKDSASNNDIALAYQNPIFPLDEPNSSQNNWTITGGIAPMMGFNLSENPSQSQEVSRLKVNITSSVQKPEVVVKNTNILYSTSISIKRSVSDKWNMRSGMSYNKISESNNNVNYIEVPVMCEYRLINKTLKLYFTNGFGAGFKQADIYPLGMSGFSFLYPLAKNIDFNLEPTYKHMFGKSWSYKADYYGMMAGVSVKF